MRVDDPFRDEFGPIDYVVVEFPGGAVTADGFRALLDLVERQLIRVLDLEFVRRGADGVPEAVDATGVQMPEGVDVHRLAGAFSGLLDRDDIAQTGAGIAAGSVAAVLVYEELALLPALLAWARDGATIIAEGPILPDELDAALDATDDVEGA